MDPSFVRAMTRWYEEMIHQNEMANMPQVQQEDENRLRSIDTLTSIMTTKDLVKILGNQLDASNYGILCVTGMQGSGKSSLIRSVSHHMHSELGYKIIYVSGFDVMEMPEKLVEQAGDAKRVFVAIDDASYVFNSVSGVAASRAKQFIGIVRHALQGAQVCLAPITHVTAGIPPILRNSNAFIFSAPTLQEYDTISKLTGKNDAAREALNSVFNSVTKIQAMAAKNPDLTLTFGKHQYSFLWGTKHRKGDGRIMLSVISGKPYVYRSVEEYCNECKHVGYAVKYNQANYMSKKQAAEKVEGQVHEHKEGSVSQ